MGLVKYPSIFDVFLHDSGMGTFTLHRPGALGTFMCGVLLDCLQLLVLSALCDGTRMMAVWCRSEPSTALLVVSCYPLQLGCL